ncbi:MAG: TonB-dependent receptor [Rhodothalassiaceae bacterium]|nr:MAG: TonB-dependent receptor [Rhodothalassiaceae bacterium]
MTTSPFTTPVSSRFLRPLLAGCAVFALLAAPVRAAEPEAPADDAAQQEGGTKSARTGAIEEIVVTAQKRAQRLQDVGVSVTAFTESMLERIGFKDSTQIVQQVPNFNYGTPVGQGNNPAFAMRAVGLVNPFEDNQEGKVAIYRDGVYQGTLAGQTLQMFDLERVEVLRGPQGTLYGRNSTGGLVNFIPRKPGDELGGFVEGVGGEFSQVRLTAGVDLPVSDRVRTRFAIDFNRDDGYVRNRFRAENFNTAGVRGNDTNTFAGRGLIAIDLDDDTDLLFNVHGSRVDQLAPYYQHQGVLREDRSFCSSEEMQQINGCFDFFDYADQDNHDAFAGSYDRRGVLQIKNVGGYMTLTRRFANGMELVSQTAVEHFSKLHQEDTDMSPVALIEPDFGVNATQFSQELRLSGSGARSKWVVGAYFFHDDRDTPSGRLKLTLFDDELIQALIGLPGALVFDGRWAQKTTSGAGFAQLEYDVLPTFTVVTGLRFTAEEKKFRYDVFRNDLGPVAPGRILDDSRSFSGISARVNLNWRPNADQLYYFAFSRGFQSGGFNGGFAIGAPLGSFGKEILNAFEVGAKTEWLDRRLRLNLAAFYYDYNKAQLLDFDPESLSNIAVNASQVTIYGGEAELVAAPVEGLTITLNLGLLDSEIKTRPGEIVLGGPLQASAPDGRQIDIRGNQLPLAPHVSSSGIVRYEHPLGAGRGRLGFQVEYSYTSKQFFSLTNDPILGEKSYSIWNFRVDWTSENEKLTLRLFANNAFDKVYKVWTFDFTPDFGFLQQFIGDPRRMGGSLIVHF